MRIGTEETPDGRTALVPHLELELVKAAGRGSPRAASARGERRARARLRSPVLIAALVILVSAAAAFAAQGLFLNGAPITLPPGTPLLPHSGLGVPLPGSAPQVVLQVADPAGGPPWGARFIATTRGYGCLQLGRVVRGALGVIGQDTAFSDDGRFHALPLDYLDGPFPCGPLDARGHAYAGVFIQGAPASGLLAEQACTPRERPVDRAQHPRPPICPARDERLVMAGMAGPQAQSVTYADNEGQLHTVATVGDQGAYLIVLPAPALGLEAGEYAPLGGAGGGTIRAITYSNGQTCRLDDRRGPYTERICPPVGEQPQVRPQLTAASVASPVSVARGSETVLLAAGRHAKWPALIVSFRARVPVTNGSSEYRVTVSCGADTVEGPITSDIRQGQLVHDAEPINCHGRTRVTVLYTYGGHASGIPTNLQGTTLIVGARTITVR